MTRIATVGLLVLWSGVCVGCSRAVSVDVVSMRVVDLSQLAAVIGDDVDLPMIRDWSRGKYLVVNIVADEDLTKLSIDRNVFITPQLAFCDHTDEEVVLGIPEVYRGGSSLRKAKLRRTQSEHMPDAGNGGSEYSLVLFETSGSSQSAAGPITENRRFSRYNLVKEPRDVCVSLRGGHLPTPSRFASSMVRIPAADIVSVFGQGVNVSSKSVQRN